MSMNYCPSCGKEYAPHSAMCPPCNYWFSTPAAPYTVSDSGFNKRQVASFAGAALLLIVAGMLRDER